MRCDGDICNLSLFLKVTEQCITDNPTIMKISECFAEFLKRAENLETFSPGLFVTDRSQDQVEPRQLSLCYRWVGPRLQFNVYPLASSPRVVVELVRHCPLVSHLSLQGYEDLCDPVVLHLAAGLPRLAHLTLPERSFVTEHGVAGLLARAPRLHTLLFPGDALWSLVPVQGA